MRPERWLQIKEIFDASVGLAPDARTAFLADACRNDSPLLKEVESLIDSYARAGAFLEEPVGLSDSGAPDGMEGRRIGPYEVGPRIGAGGMGEVYRARDTRLNRTVAIKVRGDRIAWGVNLREQFAREAKAISALNHPHICLLHDVGHDDGIDFLVMEYVEGDPIHVHCDRGGLDVRQRLSLFCSVCDAVHYAHQHLVVHRDLKPANILVTSEGQPKLLDFGIAKLIAASNTGDSPSTLSPVLTPDYASPEQIRGETVTTATDVYSLGVVLYELLAGRRPFVLRAASLEDIVHNVCETEPTAPSVALRGAHSPSTTPLGNPRELQGDLDTIVLKALRKERERRYLSAQALADDIRRHLAGETVAARGDALPYRLSKFVRRHRVAAAVAGLFIASLLAAMALVLRQSRIADAQRQRAERRFADVRRLAGSFLFEFHDAIKQLPGSTRARELITIRALEYLDSLAEESADDPTLRAELARAYQRVGDVQGGFRQANLGNIAGALASYRKALALQEALLSAASTDRSLQQDVARTLIGLGDVQLMARDIPAAHAGFRRAVDIRESLASGGTTDREAQRELAIGHHRLANAEGELGDRKAALNSLRRAIAILEPLAEDDHDTDSRYALARCYKAVGSLWALLGNYQENLTMAQKALRLNESLAAGNPLDVTIRNEVAVSSLEVGRAHQRLGNLAEALRNFRRATALSASMAAADHSNAQARWMEGLDLNLVGATLRRMHRYPEAIQAHLEAVPLLEGVSRADPANENYHYNVANTYQLIADAHKALALATANPGTKTEAWTKACSWYQRSADAFKAMRQRGTLTGAFVPDSNAVDAGLADCGRVPGRSTAHR